jgi:putative adenylate-forming enzyme
LIFDFIDQIKNVIRFIRSLMSARALTAKLKTPEDVAAHQEAMLTTWLADQARHLSYFRAYAGKPLSEWPKMDKSTLMSSFGRFNRLGVSTAKAWAMFDGRITPRKGLHVGGSTGTSGNRGLYLISDAERMDWLAVIMSKALPDFPKETAKVALVLPNPSPLYKLPQFGPLKFRFFDLHTDLRVMRPEIEDYNPDTLIAPPKTLRWMADQGVVLQLKRIFAGSEVLEPRDREIIEAHFGLKVRDIYMATEGLLGVACEHGTLHLCEDVVKFEFEPVEGTDLVNPIITDFTRREQAMIRYRMNDLLRLSPERCACGSPLQAVLAVEGRMDDVFELAGEDGTVHSVMPDVMRNTVIDSGREITDFRLQQTGADKIVLTLSPRMDFETCARAKSALATLLESRGIKAEIEVKQATLAIGMRKLRRVERAWHPTSSGS